MKIELKILNKEYYNNVVFDNKETDYLPSYATSGSVAMDLVCCKDITIYPGEVIAIHTGLAIWMGGDRDYNLNPPSAALILPRSGLGTKGLVLANTIGIIDEDYQGELIVQAWNRNSCFDFGMPDLDDERELLEIEPQIIELKSGDRFAQLMFVPVLYPEWEVVEDFSGKTGRNNGGFGSTGR